MSTHDPKERKHAMSTSSTAQARREQLARYEPHRRRWRRRAIIAAVLAGAILVVVLGAILIDGPVPARDFPMAALAGIAAGVTAWCLVRTRKLTVTTEHADLHAMYKQHHPT